MPAGAISHILVHAGSSACVGNCLGHYELARLPPIGVVSSFAQLHISIVIVIFLGGARAVGRPRCAADAAQQGLHWLAGRQAIQSLGALPCRCHCGHDTR